MYVMRARVCVCVNIVYEKDRYSENVFIFK